MTRVAAWLIAALATALVVLVGCGDQADSPPPPPRALKQAPSVPPAEVEYALTVPALRLVRAPLVEVGRNPDNTVEVPPLDRLGEVGVYRDGPMPGEVGPSVLLGHVSGRDAAGRSVDGPFRRLSTLTTGDEVFVGTPRGEVRYRVTRVERVAKEAFPTARVWSDTRGPELRLVTCGGALDSSGRNYEDNIIVFAQIVR